MAKMYYLTFSAGAPSDATGLSPTFTTFSLGGLTAISAPGITETPSGSGLYQFQYSPTLTAVVFIADGGSALDSSVRYVKGTLDPVQAVDQKVGYEGDSFGTTATDPSTLFGYAKRNLEFQEGNAEYTKSTGVWDIYSRGSSTLLREKTLTNSISEASKS